MEASQVGLLSNPGYCFHFRKQVLRGIKSFVQNLNYLAVAGIRAQVTCIQSLFPQSMQVSPTGPLLPAPLLSSDLAPLGDGGKDWAGGMPLAWHSHCFSGPGIWEHACMPVWSFSADRPDGAQWWAEFQELDGRATTFVAWGRGKYCGKPTQSFT